MPRVDTAIGDVPSLHALCKVDDAHEYNGVKARLSQGQCLGGPSHSFRFDPCHISKLRDGRTYLDDVFSVSRVGKLAEAESAHELDIPHFLRERVCMHASAAYFKKPQASARCCTHSEALEEVFDVLLADIARESSYIDTCTCAACAGGGWRRGSSHDEWVV